MFTTFKLKKSQKADGYSTEFASGVSKTIKPKLSSNKVKKRRELQSLRTDGGRRTNGKTILVKNPLIFDKKALSSRT
jgi:hypothetical protein